MNQPKIGPVGWLGGAILVADVVRIAVEWPLVRTLLHMANLGQAVDFAVEHWNHPGWLGHPLVQLAAICLGVGLLFWDTKQPKWLPSPPRPSPRSMLWIGLIVIFVGAAFIAYSATQSPSEIGTADQNPVPKVLPPVLSAARKDELRTLANGVADILNKQGRTALTELMQAFAPYPPVNAFNIDTYITHGENAARAFQAMQTAIADFTSDNKSEEAFIHELLGDQNKPIEALSFELGQYLEDCRRFKYFEAKLGNDDMPSRMSMKRGLFALGTQQTKFIEWHKQANERIVSKKKELQ